ncbi:MAG: ribosome-associated translation inhibitor RaiA [Saprospiraceae bacterium]|nr:ribosome-associated translation inhibitor RaiA [Saprospiraceae bacterium]
MVINFNQYPNFSEGVEEFAGAELSRLEKYEEKIEKADIYYRKVKDPVNEHNVEIKLAVPGADPFAKADGETFQKAFALCVDKLEAQMIKRKKHWDRHR